MRLCYEHRPHALDGLAQWQGTRLLVLDVWVEASDSDVAKLRSFNMLKHDFIETNKACGFELLFFCLVLLAAVWWSFHHAEPLITLGLALALLLFGWMAKSRIGKTQKQMIKVADLIGDRPFPFTRTNAADIHDVVVAVEERYQTLFGAMFEIEHFQVTREAIWREEVHA